MVTTGVTTLPVGIAMSIGSSSRPSMTIRSSPTRATRSPWAYTLPTRPSPIVVVTSVPPSSTVVTAPLDRSTSAIWFHVPAAPIREPSSLRRACHPTTPIATTAAIATVLASMRRAA